MGSSKGDLIREILSLDADTYSGIDDPGELERMSASELSDMLAEMRDEIGE